MTRDRCLWLLVGLVGLAFALRVIGLDAQSLWRDEVDAIRFASRPAGDLLRMFLEPGQNGPLYYLALRPWLDLAGRTGFALRFLSVALGTLAIPLVYRLGRRLFPSSPALALLAALLAATSPYLVWYGQEGKMYSLAVVLVLFGMDRYLAALAQGGWHRWLLYVAATSAAVYVHLVAALMIPVHLVLFLLVGAEVRRARWKPWLASVAVVTVPYLPLLFWQVPLLLEPGNTGYPFVPFHQMLVSLLANYSMGVLHGSASWNLVLSLGLLLAAGWLWVGQRARLASLAILAAWLCIPVLAFFLITLVRPIYTARYLIFVLPAYLLWLAAGTVAIAGRSRWLAGLWLGALLVVNGRGVWLQAQTPIKADFRGATAYLASRLEPGDLILFQIPYARFSFDYYYQQEAQRAGEQASRLPGGGRYRVYLPAIGGSGAGRYRWAEGLYTNAGMTPDEVDRHMVALIAGSPPWPQPLSSGVVWVVATEVPLWDERDLVRAWLDAHATRASQAEFVRVAVTRYELSPPR